jgi:DNA ligase-associated metallophosphoesterase
MTLVFPTGGYPIELEGEQVVLTAERAIVWPAQRALIAADLHIGKAASFRALGTPVPHGTTADTLRRLTRLIECCGVTTVYLLGDFLHSKHALPPITLSTLKEWRARHHKVSMVVIRGNHDACAGAPPADLDMQLHTAQLSVGPFLLMHHPRAHDGAYVLSGHLHPALRVSGRYDSMRLPCYWLRTRVGVLPAFGAFTGAQEIVREADDRVFVATDERVLKAS